MPLVISLSHMVVSSELIAETSPLESASFMVDEDGAYWVDETGIAKLTDVAANSVMVDETDAVWIDETSDIMVAA